MAESAEQTERNESRPRRRRYGRRALCVAGIAILIWVLGDFAYSRYVASRVARWEATIERNDDGVQVGAEARTIEGNEVALLLIHGFNDTPRAWDRMLEELDGVPWTIRLVRLSGFGVRVDQMRDCTRHDWIETVLDESRKLRAQGKSVVAVGHSLGGAVTLAAAGTDPDFASGLVLLAPAIDVSDRRSPLLPTRFWQMVGHALFWFTDIYESPYDRNDVTDKSMRNPPYKPPFSSRNIVSESLRLMDENWSRGQAIRTPVLVFLTRNDNVVDWAAAESFFRKRLSDRAGSVQTSIQFFDTSGHAMNVDVDRSAIAAELRTFVRNLFPGEPEA